MAFYKDIDKSSRQDRKRRAEARGGFEDEGARYGKREGYQQRDERPAREGQRPYARPQTESRPYGKPADRSDRPQRGGYQPRDERPAHEGQRPYARPQTESRAFGKPRTESRPFGKPADRSDRPQRGGYQPRDERPTREGQRPYARPQTESRAFGKPRTESRPFGKPADRPGRPPRGAYSDYAPPKPAFDRFRYDTPAPVPPTYGARDDEGDVVPNENLLSGRNPIREALRSGRDIEKLMIARGELSGSAREIVAQAREKHIPVQEVDRARLDAITRNHQGMLAFASAYQYHTVEDMIALAKERGEAPFLVMLDGVTDPHNLGAIIRTAECAGAHGVIVQERRAVGLTPAAVKASAGAVEHLFVARVTNLTDTLSWLKAQGVWAYAADMQGESYQDVDFSGALVLVMGAEGEGLGARVLSNCDRRVALPMRGKLESLNASVAAGILLYAAMRFR